jgi:cytochrome c-type biogenesis protein CcmH
MRALLLALMLLVAMPALAVDPDEVLADPALEARARAISADLRCLVCQNQSIDDSDADLAKDLRRVVRERLVAGDSDREVLDFLVTRYGDFVLLEPPFKPSTWLLWLGPLAIVVAGAAGIAVFVSRRNRPGTAAAPLTAAERARLDALLRSDSEA